MGEELKLNDVDELEKVSGGDRGDRAKLLKKMQQMREGITELEMNLLADGFDPLSIEEVAMPEERRKKFREIFKNVEESKRILDKVLIDLKP